MLLSAEKNFSASRAGGGQKGNFTDGKIALFEALEHFLSYGARGTSDGNMRGIGHSALGVMGKEQLV